MRKTLKRQRSPGLRRKRRAGRRLRGEGRPRQDRGHRPAGGAAGGVLARVDAALEAGRIPLLVEPVLRTVHPEVHDRVHRVPLDLGIRAPGGADVEEELDDLLVPERLVPPGEGVPGGRVRDVVAEGEALARPQREEARGDRLGTPGDALGPAPRALARGEQSPRRGARSGDDVAGRLAVDRPERERGRRLVLAGEEGLEPARPRRGAPPPRRASRRRRPSGRRARCAAGPASPGPASRLPVADPDRLLPAVAGELAVEEGPRLLRLVRAASGRSSRRRSRREASRPAPASSSSVGSQSSKPVTRSLTRPAGTRPVQRTIAGTRTPPS